MLILIKTLGKNHSSLQLLQVVLQDQKYLGIKTKSMQTKNKNDP